MHDAVLTDTWILGLNFFRDYFVEFSKEGADNYVSLWNVPANLKNHHSKVVDGLEMDQLIDNSQDKTW